MYSSSHAAMPPPQRSVAPETFLLDQDAQQSLPPEAIVALQQVDNCKCFFLCAMHLYTPRASGAQHNGSASRQTTMLTIMP
jgi:hypothetical protein